MAISAGDVLKCAIVWEMDGADNQVNTWHIQCQGIEVGATQAEIRADIHDYFGWLYGDAVEDISNNLLQVRMDVFNVSEGNPELPFASIAGLDGEDAGLRLPVGVSLMLYGRTGISRRISRKFLPSSTTGALSDTGWSSGALGRAQNMANRMASEYTDGAVVETIAAGIVNSIGSFTPIIQGVVSLEPAYQRRRRKGRGA